MKDENVILKVSSIDKERWKKAAQESGMTLSEFIRYCVNLKIEMGGIKK